MEPKMLPVLKIEGESCSLMTISTELKIREHRSNSSLVRYIHLRADTLGKYIHQSLLPKIWVK